MIVGLVLLPLAMPQIGARTSMLRRARPRVAPLKAEVLAPLKSEPESAGVCTIVEASPPQSCSYSLIENACMPMKACRVGTCGLITCDCRRLASHAQAPWDVLRLNFSSALDAKAVLTAFDKRARLLAPAKNPACLARASREYVAARRARDTLLLLSTLSTRTEAQPDHEGLLNGAKLMRTKHGSYHYRPNSSSSRSIGSRIPLLLAVKLALYRLARDCKAKMAKGWAAWRFRASKFIDSVVKAPGRMISSAWRFLRANGDVLIVMALSLFFTTMPIGSIV